MNTNKEIKTITINKGENVKSYYYPEMFREHPELLQCIFEKIHPEPAKTNEESKMLYSPQELQVMAYCPIFEKEYEKLIELGYMRKTNDGYLEWLKSKQSLAEYFGSKEKRGKWPDIENLFQLKGLNHLLSVATSKSKDYQKLLKLLYS